MMKRQMLPRLFVLLPILLLLEACSSSGKLEVKRAKTKSIPPGKSVTLVIRSEPGKEKPQAAPSARRPGQDSEPAEAQEEKKVNSVRMIQRLRSELFGRLVSEAVFKYVLHPQEKGDYLMEVRVLETEEVSQGARILLGVFAGSNKLQCAVRVVDQANGRLVTEFNVEGESAAHPLSSENGLEDAVREVVSNIIVALR